MPAAFEKGGFAVGDVLVDGIGFDFASFAEVGGKGLEHKSNNFR